MYTIISLNICFITKDVFTFQFLLHILSSFFNFLTEWIKHLQIHIVQRGAVRPLIEMLQSPDVQLREMSAFALGRLAQVLYSIFFIYLLEWHLVCFPSLVLKVFILFGRAAFHLPNNKFHNSSYICSKALFLSSWLFHFFFNFSWWIVLRIEWQDLVKFLAETEKKIYLFRKLIIKLVLLTMVV